MPYEAHLIYRWYHSGMIWYPGIARINRNRAGRRCGRYWLPNRWAIYCHFFGVAVNPRIFLPIQAKKGACFSANMRTFYSYISNPNRTGNSPFGVIDTIRNPRSLRGTSQGSRKCALLYRCSTCKCALRGLCLLCPNTADRRRGREQFCSPFAPSSKGCGPCAASRLSYEQVRRSKHDHEGGSR